MTKRVNGAGSIYHRKRGDWLAVVSLPGGQRWSKSAPTEDEARERLAELQAKVTNAVDPGDERMKLSAYLELWLSQKRRISYNTRVNYKTALDRAAAVIGKVPIGKLSPAHIRQLHRAMETTDPPYAATSMNLTHSILSMALADAVKAGVLPRNVATVVSKPAAATLPEMHPLNGEQVARLLAAARGRRFEAVFVLAVSTGMRLGEILGLRWVDVDLEAKSLRVMGSTKAGEDGRIIVGDTKRPWNRRLIPLADVAIEALRRRKVLCAEERLAARTWYEHGLVFHTGTGRPLSHSAIEVDHLRPLLDAAGCPRIHFHELRHTCATLLLMDGVPAKVVADLLGHKSVNITLDRYSHVLAEMRGVASDAMNRRFSGPVADSVAVSPRESTGI